MRIGVRVCFALLVCSGGVSVAAEVDKSEVAISAGADKTVADKRSAEVAVKVASAATPKPAREAAPGPKEPVTRTAKPVPAKPRRVAPSLVARIDLNAQRMKVTSNGKLVGSWKISSGKTGHETPPGRFRPKWTSRMHYSRKYYNSPMPYSVFFNGGIATHGTSHKRMLGRPASHGCIRLRTANARKFYNLVRRHGHKRTRIIVTGRAKQTWASRSRGRRAHNSNTFATPRRATWRQNAFGYRSSSRRRYSLDQYHRSRALRRHRQRVVSRYRRTRFVYPGDRW